MTTPNDPVVLTSEVLGNSLRYVRQLEEVCHYQSVFHPPAGGYEKNLAAPALIDRIHKDGELISELGINVEERHIDLLGVVAKHYHQIDKYFTAQEPDHSLFVLHHAAYFVHDLGKLGAEVKWLAEREWEVARYQLQTRLLDLYVRDLDRQDKEARRIIVREYGPDAAGPFLPKGSISLVPFMKATIHASRFPSGLLYYKSVERGSKTISQEVCLDFRSFGTQPQIMFSGLEDDRRDPSPGVEPDWGYVIDTLTEEGYKGIPKKPLREILVELVRLELEPA